MRINKFVAQATGLSRRAADQAIQEGRVRINEAPASLGNAATDQDLVTLDDRRLEPTSRHLTIQLHKPAGYVSSRQGQGSRTIYDLLPAEYHRLKPVGRLDKDSSGLLLLTDDGELANQLTHPSHAKVKIYEVGLDKPLLPLHHQLINDRGIQLDDGLSQLSLSKLDDSGRAWQVAMREGRNRQIRRTFNALGYRIGRLHRTGYIRLNWSPICYNRP
jgi:23S rRNA pseudouridine2605 synthase